MTDLLALPALLDRYQAIRAVEVLRLQNAAWNAMEWFEVCGARYCDPLPPEQFMYSLLTRSQRISHENLRLRDKPYLEGYEDFLAARAGVARDGGALILDAHGPLLADARRDDAVLVRHRRAPVLRVEASQRFARLHWTCLDTAHGAGATV